MIRLGRDRPHVVLLPVLKTQSNKADKSGRSKLKRPPRSDSELPTNNRYSTLETEVDNALSDSDSQNPFWLFMPMILQWNILGLQANREELDLLSSNLDPPLFASKKLFWNKIKTQISNTTLPIIEYASEVNSIVHGGSSILVKPTTPHRQIKLQTGLQAIAIRATLGKTITACSIYLPPTMVFAVRCYA